MKYLTIVSFMIFTHFNASGQYKINKTKYDSRDYVYERGDPYNPLICGAASYIMPGLGQMIAGETGRGLLFAGGVTASGVVAVYGLFSGGLNNSSRTTEGTILLTTGIVGAVVTYVWSIADAVKVAKVNNLAYRNKNRTSYNFNVEPYYSGNEALVGQSVGLKVGFRF
jgi:TM2 domain-containing membrane protein YozV